jgi:hypothetical protein
MNKQIEERVFDYAIAHPVKNLVVHAGPTVLACVFSVVFAFLGMPFLVPVFFTFGTLVLIYGAKRFVKVAMEESSVSVITAEGEAKKIRKGQPRTEYDCDNYAQTSFELRLVDAGVIGISEVSVCGDAPLRTGYCPMCHDVLVRQKKERDQHERVERQKAYNERIENAVARDNEKLALMFDTDAQRVRDWQHDLLNIYADDRELAAKRNAKRLYYDHRSGIRLIKAYAMLQSCRSCGDDTMYEFVCPTDRLTLERQKDEEDRAEAERKRVEAFEERRRVVVNGLRVTRPLEVPEGAVPSLLHGRDIDPMATHSYIVWKWTEDGVNHKGYKQPIAIDAFSVHADGQRHPIFTHYAAYDDGTGEYLGEYTTVSGNGTKQDPIRVKAVPVEYGGEGPTYDWS